jgi:hypothetical protein
MELVPADAPLEETLQESEASKKKAAAPAAATERTMWPEELTMPPRHSTSPLRQRASADRFSSEPRFGDEVNETRPLPNIFFKNGHGSDEDALSPRLRLPETIHFFVRVKWQRVSYPFPAGVSTKKYLRKAKLSADGQFVTAVMPFDEKHVIGLAKHQVHTLCQLVLEVPSDANPRLHATKLCFHPRHHSQLHQVADADPGDGSPRSLPRLIVTVWPIKVSRPSASHARAALIERSKAYVPRFGTFGTSDGRMGPAFVTAKSVRGELLYPSRSWAMLNAEEFAAAREVNPAAAPHLTEREREEARSRRRSKKKEKKTEEEKAAEAVEEQKAADEEAVFAIVAHRDTKQRVMRPSFLLA